MGLFHAADGGLADAHAAGEFDLGELLFTEFDLGELLFTRVHGSADYLTQVLPAVVVLGFGLAAPR